MVVWLKVPYAEKDEAKALGARWSPAQKKWYVKDAADLTPFQRWLDVDAPASAVAAPVDEAPPANGAVIFCDGACRGNPGGPGGWGALIRTPDGTVEIFGGSPDTTNNRMELTAAAEALRWLPQPCDVVVYTDSQYVVNGMNQWRHGWVRKNWKDVKNVELWKTLIAEADRHRATFKWVRGHNGHVGNERADALANEGLDHAQRTGKSEAVVRVVAGSGTSN
ncbi:MAG: ribonuclease HI [Pigmentiphaga sp.]|jgi:Ribonuclease HI|nr:ribonuclease HI [Pigmentiphaga sp.]